MIKKFYKVNQNIRDPQLRVVSSSGKNLGILKKEDALEIARRDELDLVVIVEKANPPVAKVVEFNKFLYEEKKKASAAKAKSKTSGLKEFRFGPTISEFDLNVRINRAKKFIGEDNHRVRVTIQMKGREASFPELAKEKINRFTSGLEGIGKPEEDAKRISNSIIITYAKD